MDTSDQLYDLVADFVAGAPYRPRLAPDELEGVGVDPDVVEDVRELFRTFNSGPVETVVPALPVFAAAVGSEGERSL